jgi:hypothetical protein
MLKGKNKFSGGGWALNELIQAKQNGLISAEQFFEYVKKLSEKH